MTRWPWPDAIEAQARRCRAAELSHRDDVEALRTEVERLRDGIREAGHHDWCGYALTGVSTHCNCPMALLDDQENTT